MGAPLGFAGDSDTTGRQLHAGECLPAFLF